MESISREMMTYLTNKELSKLKIELEYPSNKKRLNIRNINHVKNRRMLNIIVNDSTVETSVIKVKLEVHSTYTCTERDIVIRRLGKAAREEFDTDCAIRSVSDSILYSGKFVAFLVRNSVKDGFDMYKLFNEKIDFANYKESIIYTLLGTSKSVVYILNFNENKIPKEYNLEYDNLGSTDYSKEKHIKTMKETKNVLLKMLNEQDCCYIMASALGILDQTDYKFKNRISVRERTNTNKKIMKNKSYRLKTLELLNVLTKKGKRVRELYLQYGTIEYTEKEN